MPSIIPTTIKIRDWRIAEGTPEADLPEAARGEYTLTLESGPYDNLVIHIASPAGHQSMLRIEADGGLVKLVAYAPDREDPSFEPEVCDLIAYLRPEGVTVESNYTGNPVAVFDHDTVSILTEAELRQRFPAES